MLDLIERKAAGETITIEEPEPEQKEVPGPDGRARGLDRRLQEPAEEEGDARRNGASELEARRRQRRRSRWRRARVEVEVEGRELSLSNLDKVMYPETGFTKGQVIDYYTRVAPALLPHLRDRPLTLKRYPNGVEGGHFYEKQCPSHRPDWVRSEPVELSSKTIHFCVCDDLPTLVWLANLADLELHPSLSKVPEVERPTRDGVRPRPRRAGAGIAECCEVALILREALGRIGLECFAEDIGLEGHPGVRAAERGRRGLRPRHQAALAGARPAPRGRASEADRVEPEEGAPQGQGADRLEPERRAQDDRRRSTRCAPASGPTVSTPLDWDEVAAGDPDALVFEAADVLERVEERGDLFAPVAELEQRCRSSEPAYRSGPNGRLGASPSDRRAGGGTGH